MRKLSAFSLCFERSPVFLCLYHCLCLCLCLCLWVGHVMCPHIIGYEKALSLMLASASRGLQWSSRESLSRPLTVARASFQILWRYLPQIYKYYDLFRPQSCLSVKIWAEMHSGIRGNPFLVDQKGHCSAILDLAYPSIRFFPVLPHVWGW